MSLAGGATAGPPPAAVHDAVVGALRRSRAAPPGGAARSVLSQLRSVALRDDICRRLDAPPRAPNLVAVAPDIWQADFGGGGKCWGSEVLRLASRKSLGDVQWAVELLQEQLGATDVDVTIAQREAEAGYRVAATTAALYCGGGGSEAAWLAPSAFEVDAPPSRGRAARAALRGGALRCEERLARIGGAPCFGGVLRCVEVSVDVIVTGPDLSRAVDLFALLVLRRSIHAARARASCRVVALETAAAGPAFGGDGTPAAKTAAAAFSAAPVALRWDVSRLKSDPAAQANFTLALRTATVTLHAPARLALLALAPQQRSERPRLVHFEVEFTLHFRAAARPGPQATSFTRSARADDGVFFSREAADRYVAGRAGAPRAAAAPVDAARAALQRGDANAALIALVPSLLLDRQRAATADGGAVDAAVLRRGLYTLRFGPRELRCGALALADAARILARHLRSEDFAGGGGADDWLDAFDADFAKWRRSALLYVGGDAGPDAALLAQTLRAEIVAFSRDGAEASAAATDACLVRMVAAAAQQRVDDHDHAAHAPHVPHSEAPLARRRVPRAAVAPSAERRRDEVVDALLLGATGGGTCLRAEFLGRASPEDKAGGARLHKCAAGLAALAHRLEAVGAALGVLERSVTCDALATLGVRETVEARRAQQRTARQTRGRAPDKGVCDALAALLQRPDGARVDTDAGETTPRPQHAEAPGDAAAVSATLVAVEAGADVSLDVQGLDGALAQSRLDGAFAAATRAVAASRARREAPRLAWFVDGGGAADGGGGDDDASFGAGGDPDDVGRLAAACERELYDAAVSAVAPAQPWTALISRVSCDVARSQTETSSHRDDIALFERALTARHAAQPCADAAPPAAKRRSASLGDRAPAWDRLRTFEFFEDCSSTAAAVASAAAAAWKRQRLRVAVAAQRTKNVQKSYDDQLAHNVAAGVAMDRLGAAATLRRTRTWLSYRRSASARRRRRTARRCFGAARASGASTSAALPTSAAPSTARRLARRHARSLARRHAVRPRSASSSGRASL
ncbi:hypothetical protein M885DRAFT_151693 [Pelagophyceae sp. CCMP2097]|nr:hypothetical protein M885DRAFT_151693 [Pelagophyceae sp. CCMP2097]